MSFYDLFPPSSAYSPTRPPRRLLTSYSKRASAALTELAKPPPPPPPPESFGVQSDEDQYESMGSQGEKQFLKILCVLIVLVTVLLLLVWAIFCRQRRSKKKGEKNPPVAPNGDGVATANESISPTRLQRTFTYNQLEEATENFHESNLLGEGGFGKVHKGYLGADRKPVAIKKLKPGSEQGEKEFLNEVEIISGIHHRNLVHLVGYCISESQRLLVYDFIPNKSLESHLHGEDKSALNWQTRFNIARDTANGLAYLHECCDPPIIHRDIKSANILLDNNFQAKVADFGLAKLFPDDKTHISTAVKGTFGYLDPEYYGSGKLTEKSDVYSFGILLLELITGTPPKGNLALEAKHLLTRAVKDGNFDFVDQDLQDYDEIEMSRVIGCAAACVCYSAKERPKMSQIREALEGNLDVKVLTERINAKPNAEFDSMQNKENGENSNSGSSNYVDCSQSLPNSTEAQKQFTQGMKPQKV